MDSYIIQKADFSVINMTQVNCIMKDLTFLQEQALDVIVKMISFPIYLQTVD